MVRHRGQFHSDPADLAVKMHKCQFCDFESFRKDKVTRHVKRKHSVDILKDVRAPPSGLSANSLDIMSQSYVNPALKE